MPSTLADLNLEIQKQSERLADLKREAEEIKARERESIIDAVRQQIEDYEITAAELGFARPGSKPQRLAGAAKSPKGAAKYFGPEGQTWTGGRGRKPRWVTEGLAAGKTLADFERKPAR